MHLPASTNSSLSSARAVADVTNSRSPAPLMPHESALAVDTSAAVADAADVADGGEQERLPSAPRPIRPYRPRIRNDADAVRSKRCSVSFVSGQTVRWSQCRLRSALQPDFARLCRILLRSALAYQLAELAPTSHNQRSSIDERRKQHRAPELRRLHRTESHGPTPACHVKIGGTYSKSALLCIFNFPRYFPHSHTNFRRLHHRRRSRRARARRRRPTRRRRVGRH
jgi:hypothetical protein